MKYKNNAKLNDKFKIGDVVRLKISSTLMVIDGIISEQARCVWQDEYGKPQIAIYNLRLLIKDTENEERTEDE